MGRTRTNWVTGRKTVAVDMFPPPGGVSEEEQEDVAGILKQLEDDEDDRGLDISGSDDMGNEEYRPARGQLEDDSDTNSDFSVE